MFPALHVGTSLRAKQSNPRSWLRLRGRLLRHFVPRNDVNAMLITMTLSGCSLLKKDSSVRSAVQQTSSVSEQRRLDANRLVQTNQHFLEWRLDSLSSNDAVMIWPKGKFTFSALGGFEGEAEKMVISSDLNRSETGLKMKDSLVNEKGQFKAEQLYQSDGQLRSKTITKTQDPAFWPVIAAVFILTTGVIIYKLLNKRI